MRFLHATKRQSLVLAVISAVMLGAPTLSHAQPLAKANKLNAIVPAPAANFGSKSGESHNNTPGAQAADIKDRAKNIINEFLKRIFKGA
jgi:hypothetical protein